MAIGNKEGEKFWKQKKDRKGLSHRKRWQGYSKLHVARDEARSPRSKGRKRIPAQRGYDCWEQRLQNEMKKGGPSPCEEAEGREGRGGP